MSEANASPQPAEPARGQPARGEPARGEPSRGEFARGRPDRGEPSEGGSGTGDVTRRTWLAAERTWLAWWRTGIAVAAVGIAVGRILPEITHGAKWPFRFLGIAYGLLAVGVLLVGAARQQRTADALRRGSYDELSSPLVMWLTAAATVLAVGGVVLVAIRL